MALLQCPECGSTVSDRATVCPKCGQPLHPAAPQQGPAQGYQQVYNARPQRPALTPDQEAYLDKFHWGPFALSWIWALCNELVVYGLIALVVSMFTWGIGGTVACFVFGFKGSRWAWEKSKTATFEEFVRKQEPWDKWGKILFIASVALIVLYVIFAVVLVGSSY
jgi:hypothetical protein